MIIHVDKAYVYVSLKEDVIVLRENTSYQKKKPRLHFIYRCRNVLWWCATLNYSIKTKC